MDDRLEEIALIPQVTATMLTFKPIKVTTNINPHLVPPLGIKVNTVSTPICPIVQVVLVAGAR